MTTYQTYLPSQPPIYPTSGALPSSTSAGVIAIVLGTPLSVYGYNGTSWDLLTSGAIGTVSSVTGTANQITTSPTSGAVIASIPSDFRPPGTVAIGGAPVASAQLTMLSTTQGFLPPSMTTTQKNAIASPASGLVVYDNILASLQFYNGSTWGAPVGGVTTLTGTANQITASASTGAVTLSVPSDFRPPGTLAIGGAPNAVAALTVTSTTKGILPPLLTTTQKNLITPTIGLLLFDTTLGVLQVYNGTAWASATPLPTFFAGSVIYYDGTNYAASGSTFFFDSATSTLGIGTFSVNTGANLYISSSKAYGIMIAGTQSLSASSLTAGLIMSGTYQKASGTLAAARVISATASFTADVGATITLATSFYCVPTASTNAGTITEIWGLYVASNGGAGTVSKAGGAYIASSSCGTTTNNYGLQVAGIDSGGSATGTRYLNYYSGTITADDGTFSAAMYNNVTMTPTTNTRNVYGFFNSPVAAPNSTNAITIAYGAYHGLTVTVGTGSVGTAYSCYNANPTAGTKRVALYTDSIAWSVTTSSATSITLAMTALIYNLSSTSARAVTLPNANTLPTGLCWIVKDTGGAASTAPITITPTTSTIDGAATFVIAANYGAAFIYNDGTNYFVG